MAPPKQPFLLWRTESDDPAELPRGPNPSDMPGMQERLHTLLPPNTVRAPTVQEVAAGGAPSPQTVRRIKDLAALIAAPAIGPAGLTAYAATRDDPEVQGYASVAPGQSQDPLKGLDWPEVPSNATDPNARLALMQRMVGASGGPGGVRAPGIQAASLQDPEVQAQLQDPRVRAAMAPAAGDIEFNPQDFLRAPSGEDQLERFTFRELAVLGDRAPKAMQAAWLNIQTSKQARLSARADYFASLVKERYAADLQRRNQGDRINAQEAANALDRVTQIRNQEAALKMQAQVVNAQLLEQYKGRMSAENIAAMKQAMADGAWSPERVKAYRDSTTIMRDAGDTMIHAASLVDQAQNIAARGGVALGKGDLGRWWARAATVAGDKDYQEFNMTLRQVQNSALRALAKAAGVKSIDTKPEQDKLNETFPGIGSHPELFDKWLNEILRINAALLEDEATSLNHLSPGDGTKRLEDMREIRERLVFSQAGAAARLRAAGENADYASAVNY